MHRFLFLFVEFLTLASISASASASDSFNGIWASPAYGRVWLITDDSVAVYQLNQGRLLRSSFFVGSRTGSGITITSEQLESTSEYMLASADESLMAIDAEDGKEYLYQRLSALPTVMAASADPDINFTYLRRLVADRYPFLEERGARWHEVGDSLQQFIDKTSTDSALFSSCCRLIDELGYDGHVWLKNDAGDVHSPSFNHPGRAVRPKKDLLFLIGEHYLDQHQYHAVANGKVIFKILSNDIGYVNFLSFSGMSESDDLRDQLASLEDGLDELVDSLQNARGVIIDVRYNGGGHDALALAAAGLLAKRTDVAFSRTTRLAGTNSYTEPRVFFVRPRKKNLADKPVVVLSSKYTASAAEVFLMATLQMDHVTRMGEPSFGVLSDTFIHELPNGWLLAMYSERYYAFDGSLYEISGVPVHHTCRISEQDFEDNRDAVFESAIETLQQSTE